MNDTSNTPPMTPSSAATLEPQVLAPDVLQAPAPAPEPIADLAAEPLAEQAADPLAEPVADPLPAVAAPAVVAAPPQAEMTPGACAAKLKALFPALFAGTNFKPLKLRVQIDIQERAPGLFTKAQLSAFLRRHTGNTGYLIAPTKATHRYDLDGQPVAEFAEEHRLAAREELTRPARQNFSTNRPRRRCLSDEHGLLALGFAARA